ncbi:MAG TPA: ABC transporter ATP-binding protein [Pirellulales bacterium]|jgi:ABC-type multidrug transport system ATPase subunit|nr:ABC transporter ATP-binding protein [Pirellulales bacterium]
MIRVVDIVQHYGVRPVLKQISLDIDAGQLVVFVGPNGMGKTTLLNVMAGVLSPQRGYVEFDGLRRRGSADDEIEIRRRVVFLPDHPWLPNNFTGREFLQAVGRLYDVEDTRLMDHVERLLTVFELLKEGDWPIRSYSNGQQKKIAICSALVTEAPVLLLDEPFAGGLDPAGIMALRRILRHHVEHSGATVILTTPVPELVEELADRIVVIRDGELLAYDTPEGLRRQTRSGGSLTEALQRLIFPEAIGNIEQYLKEARR